ncbi:DUF502 domain-containing protein [Zobellella taiwanensis]|jgi:uncharacterized membrane protein|uniref:DUF502 domain-containing protein n=1 Tax=Zobellella taiwanensis TaxID=347535 RepID=A0A2P7R2V2_9GAMM|nr:DUF502 domain-containing protein [Zobellella taiwanensis]PSJ44557.1 hypothetical protein C7I36_06560 [Zobellella taiwanensis]
MQRLIRFFFQGLLILLPVVLTVYLVYLIFTMLNETLFSALGSLLRIVFPALEAGWISDLAGGLVTLVVIILTGMFASFYLGRFMLSLFDRVLARIPLVKLLYHSLKDLFNALLGDNKRFDQPVVVSLMGGEVMVLGFITREDMAEFGLKGKVAVYLPQSYNFAGNLLLVDGDKVRPLDVPAGAVTTFIVSGGVTGAKT